MIHTPVIRDCIADYLVGRRRISNFSPAATPALGRLFGGIACNLLRYQSGDPTSRMASIARAWAIADRELSAVKKINVSGIRRSGAAGLPR